MSEYRLLIDGELVAGASQIDVVNPATGQPFAQCARANADQLDQAIAAASAAFPTWSTSPLAERRAALTALAAALGEKRDAFAHLLTQEQGRPLEGAMFEVVGSILLLEYFASLDLGETVLRDNASEKIVKQRVPLGVVAAITPWNFPLLLLITKIAPALLAGNTVVAKPAPTTPLTTLRFGELCAGILPAGVLNIIVDENDLGDRLTQHPDIAKVAFTGATETGRQVMRSSASTLKRLTLELGGNDAAIILDDVDPEKIAPQLFAGAMMNSGQLCVATKRVYVHDNQYDAFCDALAHCARAAVVGDGMTPGVQLGPVQNRRQYERLLQLIEDAGRTGTIIAGGGPLPGDGYFIAPTIVRDLPDDARLVREEQFGPVVPVLRYADLDDAIRRANDSEFGLGGTVWSGDPDRAMAVADRIDAGLVCINKNPDLQPDIPLVGAKHSGFGAELGCEGLEEFTRIRIVSAAR